MGDTKKGIVRVEMHPRFKLESRVAKITSDGGILVFRELAEY